MNDNKLFRQFIIYFAMGLIVIVALTYLLGLIP